MKNSCFLGPVAALAFLATTNVCIAQGGGVCPPVTASASVTSSHGQCTLSITVCGLCLGNGNPVEIFFFPRNGSPSFAGSTTVQGGCANVQTPVPCRPSLSGTTIDIIVYDTVGGSSTYASAQVP